MSERDLLALVVDDDDNFRVSLSALIRREGYEAVETDCLEKARTICHETTPHMVVVDLDLPDGDGLDLVRDPECGDSEFIVVTGNATVDTAVAALREGALDYLTKPVDRSRLKSVLAHVARSLRLKSEVQALRSELRELGRFGPMVGRSAPMQAVYDLIARVAPTQAPVFVIGESGTGKELVAQTIHELSPRKEHPFIAVNCGAISSSLIESELFGHEKGAFTGATGKRAGYFEAADGGTLFLDEITEMAVELQVRLLRVLETGMVQRIGANEPIKVDVRLVAATNRDPAEAIADGSLREDLHYRLNVFPISLPPLREREGDIALLADELLDRCNARDGVERHWSKAALQHLESLRFPGNVRELKNAVERAAILGEGELGPELLPSSNGGPQIASSAPTSQPDGDAVRLSVGCTIADAERELISATLKAFDGDKPRAAETLGISLKTLYNRLNAYKHADLEGARESESS